jgi:formylglycine-generating enzyme required for sulfatase activity
LKHSIYLSLIFACFTAACEHMAAPQPSPAFRDCADCPEMVAIPAGSFLMGAAPNEARAPWVAAGATPSTESDRPQRRVTVPAFAIAKFDVTRAQWAAFVAATNRVTASGCEWAGLPRDEAASASWRHLGFAQEDDHPAVCVSWNDAQAYARWLSERTGHAYRLPTEAEWEYAARAGSTTTYPWGDVASHEHANYGAEECCTERAEGRDQWLHTSPVGAFSPNAFGLYDMHGNAWQWVADCYVEPYLAAPVDGSAYDEPGCTRRVLRGGTWGDPPALIRSAYRNWAPPPRWNPEWEYRSGGVGFRVARSLS